MVAMLTDLFGIEMKDGETEPTANAGSVGPHACAR